MENPKIRVTHCSLISQMVCRCNRTKNNRHIHVGIELLYRDIGQIHATSSANQTELCMIIRRRHTPSILGFIFSLMNQFTSLGVIQCRLMLCEQLISPFADLCDANTSSAIATRNGRKDYFGQCDCPRYCSSLTFAEVKNSFIKDSYAVMSDLSFFTSRMLLL